MVKKYKDAKGRSRVAWGLLYLLGEQWTAIMKPLKYKHFIYLSLISLSSLSYAVV